MLILIAISLYVFFLVLFGAFLLSNLFVDYANFCTQEDKGAEVLRISTNKDESTLETMRTLLIKFRYMKIFIPPNMLLI